MAEELRRVITAGRLVRAVQYTMIRGPGERARRTDRRQISSAVREHINLKYSRDKLKMLLAANFAYSDPVITLTYDDSALPRSKREADRRFANFLRRFRAARLAAGTPLRYAWVTEGDHSAGRYHHHWIINASPGDRELIRRLWARNGKIADFDLIGSNGYAGWADYLTKEPREHGKPRVGEHMWHCSRGMLRPVIETETVGDHADLAAPPGAIILMQDCKLNSYGRFRYLEYILPE